MLLRNTGACIAPDNAWMFLQGIETLALRMDRHCSNSLAVAKALQASEKVDWVRYPGLETDSQYEAQKKYLKGKGGSMVVFSIKAEDPLAAGKKFIEALTMVRHVANVGSAQSLAAVGIGREFGGGHDHHHGRPHQYPPRLDDALAADTGCTGRGRDYSRNDSPLDRPGDTRRYYRGCDEGA